MALLRDQRLLNARDSRKLADPLA
jgi:hypothetical protein